MSEVKTVQRVRYKAPLADKTVVTLKISAATDTQKFLFTNSAGRSCQITTGTTLHKPANSVHQAVFSVGKTEQEKREI